MALKNHTRGQTRVAGDIIVTPAFRGCVKTPCQEKNDFVFKTETKYIFQKCQF
jgi:hypothetical protein